MKKRVKKDDHSLQRQSSILPQNLESGHTILQDNQAETDYTLLLEERNSEVKQKLEQDLDENPYQAINHESMNHEEYTDEVARSEDQKAEDLTSKIIVEPRK